MEAKRIDPWSSDLIVDYDVFVEQFGLEKFDPSMFPKPNRLMRRGVTFAGRDLKRIADCIKEKRPFYNLTGIMPSADRIHFGNKATIESTIYFQSHGGKTFVLVADLESSLARGIGLDEARKRAVEIHIPSYIALGLDPKKTIFYFQSRNIEPMRLAFLLGRRVTPNEFKAIYGSNDHERVFSSMIQVGDILWPQLEEEMPGIIPVGVDQDPHIRLTRDIVHRAREFKFFPPSSVYNKFTKSLDGTKKMSKSKPESCIELPESEESFTRKIQRALSGGRKTLEDHRKYGADVEKCMVFHILEHHLVEDDKELEGIYQGYKSGSLSVGEIKDIAIDKMKAFMKDFERKFKMARGKEIKFLGE